MNVRGFRAPILIAAAAAACIAIASPGDLTGVLQRFDDVQAGIDTLSADFTEKTENRMLEDPLVATGSFYLTKPASVLWEYDSPEEMRFVVANDTYVGYFPKRKRAEKRDVHRWSEQIFRFFSVGQGSAELRKFYDIRLEDPGAEVADSYLLVLEPIKRRVKKRVREVRLWIDRATLLPRRVEYAGEDDYSRVIDFSNVRVNPELSAGLYNITIPADVSVTTGFSAFGSP